MESIGERTGEMRRMLGMVWIALASTVAVAWASGQALAVDFDRISVHGFISQGYLRTTDNNYLAETEDGTFEFNEAGINFSYTDRRLRVGMQLFSRDLGDLGNNDIVLDWALADYRFSDLLGIRMGRIKAPIGLYNQTRDLDFVRTPILLPNAVYHESGRDFTGAYNGVGLYGLVAPPVGGDIEYELYGGSFNLESDSPFLKGMFEQINAGAIPEVGGPVTAEDLDFDTNYAVGTALRWSPSFVNGLRVGLSVINVDAEVRASLHDPSGGYLADYRSNLELDYATVYSAEYTWDRLVLAAELSTVNINNRATISPVAGVPPHGADADITQVGWYLQASYQYSPLLTFGLYYVEYYPDQDDKEGDRFKKMGQPDYLGWQKALVPTVRIDVNDNWIIKAETHLITGAADTTAFDNPDGWKEDWILFAVKTSFNF